MYSRTVDIESDQFKQLSYDFVKESGQDFDEEHFFSSWKTLTDDGLASTIGYFDGDKLMGMIGFLITDDIFSGKKIISETFLFVKEKYRARRIGLRLLRDFEQMGNDNKAYECCIAHFNHLTPKKLKSFYTKLGYKATEEIYKKCLW